MKTTIFNKKALAFFGAAAILLAAVFTTGCKTDAGSGDPAPETFAVAFSVDGANGTLKAKADGVAETDKSPIVVQKGKTVTFTAAPDSGYRVKGWTLDGTAVNGTNNSYAFSVTKAVNVQVSFESNSTPLSKYTVTFSVDDGNGKLKAKADGVAETAASPISVEKGKTVTFTATPKNGYKVDKWTITGGTFETGTGTEGSTTAKVTITANTKVSVSFKSETITPPSPTEFTVEMKAGEHGTLSANPVIPASGKVAKDTEITFTAAPATGYKVDKWTIIAKCLLKQHQEPEKRSYKDEDSQQPFASTRSTCVQWDCIPANTAAGKSVPASIFSQGSVKPLFYEMPHCP